MTKGYIDYLKGHKNIQQPSHAFKCYIISISHAPTQITCFCIQLSLVKGHKIANLTFKIKQKKLMIEKMTITIKVD
jgi:hypothetical protein